MSASLEQSTYHFLSYKFPVKTFEAPTNAKSRTLSRSSRLFLPSSTSRTDETKTNLLLPSFQIRSQGTPLRILFCSVPWGNLIFLALINSQRSLGLELGTNSKPCSVKISLTDYGFDKGIVFWAKFFKSNR